MSTVIKIENLSKQYRLGLIGSGTLRDDMIGWWYRLCGKPDPTLMIGMENQVDKSGGEYIWALKDINLEVKQGERLGIIGKNGAGKSTLLKILSRVTGPTTGSVKVKGRIASLLEVGTGFHGELTGRENIYLNGTILGMKKWEINKKFEEIIDFSGVEKYIDTPVKRYSSGMYVRLAFAVAAYLEPDILVVDEVLAVGDVEFQKKALGKMKDVSEGEGRTVLFVSHNMTAISALCTNAIVLKQGKISYYGKVEDCLNYYLNNVEHIKGYAKLEGKKSELWKQKQSFSKLISIETLNSVNNQQSVFKMGSSLRIKLEIEITELKNDIEIGIFIFGQRETLLDLLSSAAEGFKSFKKGIQEFLIEIPVIHLMPGEYTIGTWIVHNRHVDDACENAVVFEIISDNITSNFVDYNRFKGYNHLIRSNWLTISK